jgi:hypothetical protein
MLIRNYSKLEVLFMLINLVCFRAPYFFLEKKVGKNSRRFDASVFPWLPSTQGERQNVAP